MVIVESLSDKKMFKKILRYKQRAIDKKGEKNYSQWKKIVLFNKPKIEALIITNIIIARDSQ